MLVHVTDNCMMMDCKCGWVHSIVANSEELTGCVCCDARQAADILKLCDMKWNEKLRDILKKSEVYDTDLAIVLHYCMRSPEIRSESALTMLDGRCSINWTDNKVDVYSAEQARAASRTAGQGVRAVWNRLLSTATGDTTAAAVVASLKPEHAWPGMEFLATPAELAAFAEKLGPSAFLALVWLVLDGGLVTTVNTDVSLFMLDQLLQMGTPAFPLAWDASLNCLTHSVMATAMGAISKLCLGQQAQSMPALLRLLRSITTSLSTPEYWTSLKFVRFLLEVLSTAVKALDPSHRSNAAALEASANTLASISGG